MPVLIATLLLSQALHPKAQQLADRCKAMAASASNVMGYYSEIFYEQ